MSAYVPQLIAQIVFIFGNILYQLGLGRALCRVVLGANTSSGISTYFVAGFLIHTSLLFGLMSLTNDWILATCIAAIPLLFVFRDILPPLCSLKSSLSINLIFWLATISTLGTTFFNLHSGIQTIWSSNFADFPFHMGMISSFAIGDNFPPEYHLFPGTRLSYPFFVNLWAASVWWINPSYTSLKFIFIAQWTLLWLVVFGALNAAKHRLLPWTLLFGGGTYFAVYYQLSGDETYSIFRGHTNQMIAQGFPWTNFLDTVWIPQRSALLGLAVCLIVLKMFHTALKDSALSESERGDSTTSNLESDPQKRQLVLSALILALSPLAHGHFFLITTLYCVGVLYFRKRGLLRVYLPVLCISFIFLPWLTGKAGIISLSAGWMPWPRPTPVRGSEYLLNSATMWLKNASPWFLSVGLLWFASRRHQALIVLAFLFLLFNFVQIAVWPWDQIKIFIAIYAITISLWSSLDSKRSLKLEWFLVILIIPAACGLIQLYRFTPLYEIYSADALEKADEIKEQTPHNAIILAAPSHNSTVTLTGRRLFAGYEGTLVSHGIDYKQRFSKIKRLSDYFPCEPQNNDDICPNYLFWSEQEGAYWSRQSPSELSWARQSPIDYLFEVHAEKR